MRGAFQVGGGQDEGEQPAQEGLELVEPYSILSFMLDFSR